MLAGCGSSSSNAPTQAEFAAHANAICVAGLRSAARLKAPKSTAELLSFSEQTSAIVSRLAHELSAVQAPANARADYSRFVKSVAHEAQLLEEAVAGLRAHDAARARKALEALSANGAKEEAKAWESATAHAPSRPADQELRGSGAAPVAAAGGTGPAPPL